tara:strand:- start:632 stop:778 length:147 start_codon:yes stop_codon:yes gene_type:complete
MFYKVVMYKDYDGVTRMGAMPYGSLSAVEDKGYRIDADASNKPAKESK